MSDSPGVSREQFASTDLDETERFLCDRYTDMSLRLVPPRAGFRFRHDTLAAADFAVSHFSSALGFEAEVIPLGHVMVAVLHRGAVTRTNHRHGAVRFGTGEVALSPVTEPYRSVVGSGRDDDPDEIDVIVLDAARLADHAEHTTGIPAGELDFTGLRPLSDELARHWIGTTTHLRDDVLTNPWAAGQPIVLDNAFRSLAAAALSTFPNTALEQITDPHAPSVRGDVPVSALREVVDYLDAHAGLPVGPADVAELTGRPANDVTEGLRRRYDRHPATLLWQARLRGVHRDLRDATPESGTTVGELATSWGFTDIGRFRIAYLHRFGEPPEATLRR